jgi:hypothetical protein
MGPTAQEMGVDINDPGGNITGGAHFLSKLLRLYGGNVRDALAAYNTIGESRGSIAAGYGYADQVMADAAAGRSVGMPRSALIPAGASAGNQVTVAPHTVINITGFSDPHAIANQVTGAWNDLWNTITRDFAPVLR